MSLVNIFTDNASSIYFTARDANGIPWVVKYDLNGNVNTFHKGNAPIPTSFTALTSSITSSWAKISGSMVGPFELFLADRSVDAMSNYDLNGNVVNLTADTINSTTILTFDGADASNGIVIKGDADSNGDMHLLYHDRTTSMGNLYRTVYYVNNVGGSWNSRVEIFGASTQKVGFPYSLWIDKNDIPWVRYTNTTDNLAYLATGNTTNATSFSSTSFSAYTLSDTYVLNNGNFLNPVLDSLNDELEIQYHKSGDTIDSWSSITKTFSGFSSNATGKIVGNSLIVAAYSGTTSSDGQVMMQKIDFSGDVPIIGDSIPVSGTTGFTGSYYQRADIYNYDVDGVDLKRLDSRKHFELTTHNTAANPDEYYYRDFLLVPSVKLNTSGGTEFSGSTPALEFTGNDPFNEGELEYDVEIATSIDKLISSYTVTDTNTNLGPLFTKIGMAFSGTGDYVTSVSWELRKVGSPSGYTRAYLYLASNDIPTGATLATSSILDADDLGTTYELKTFYFDPPYRLEKDANYAVSIEYEYDTGSASDYVQVQSDGFGSAGTGSLWISSWQFTSNDFVYYLSGSTLLLEKSSDIDTTLFDNIDTPADNHPFNDEEKVSITPTDDEESETLAGGSLFSWPTTQDMVGSTIVGRGGYLKSFAFRTQKSGSPTGNAEARVYATSGATGTINNKPTGGVLATSNSFDVSTISGQQTVYFTFPTPYLLSADTTYGIVIYYTGATGSDTILYSRNGTNPSDELGMISYSNASSSWTISLASDFGYWLNVELKPATYYYRARARIGNKVGYWSDFNEFSVALGPQTYNVSVTLTSDHLLSGTTSGSTFSVPISLTGDSTFSTSAGKTIDDSLTLSGDSTLTSSAFSSLFNSATLTSDHTIDMAIIVDYFPSATLTSDHTIDVTNIADVTDSTTLTSDHTLASSALLDITDSISLTSDHLLEATAGLSISDTISLTGDSTFTTSALSDYLASATLTSDHTLTADAFNIFNLNVSLTGDSTLTVSTFVGYAGSITLTSDHVLTAKTGDFFLEEVVLSGTSDIAVDSTYITYDSITLTSDHTVNFSSDLNIDESISLITDNTLITTTNIDYLSSISLTSDHLLNALGGLSLNESISLTSDHLLNTTGSLFLDANLNLTGDTTIIVDNIVNFNGLVTLVSDHTITTNTLMNLLDSITLNSDHLLETISDMLIDGTITLTSDHLIDVSGGLALNDGITLSGDSSLIVDAILASNPTITLTSDHLLDVSEVIEYNAEVTLTADNTLTDNGLGDLNGDSILTSDHLIDMTVQTLADAIVNLTIGVTMDASAGSEFFDNLTLTSDHTDLYQALSDFVSTLDLPADATLISSIISDFVSSLNLSIDVSDTYSVIGDDNQSITLTSNHTLTTQGSTQNIFDENISLTAKILIETYGRKSPFTVLTNIKVIKHIKTLIGH